MLKAVATNTAAVLGDLLPAVDQVSNIGSTAKNWAYAYVAALRDQVNGNNRIRIFANDVTQLIGSVANSGSNVAVQIGNTATLTVLTYIAGFYADSAVATRLLGVHNSGRLDFSTSDASGTPGAATINKPSGQVAIAAAAASVVVTNSLVSTTSIVLPVIQTADATLTFIKSCVPASGSFTITGNANATAATKVGFLVFNL